MNEFHRRSIGTAFRHIDTRLSQIEAILQAVGAQSPFSEYAFDIGPTEQIGIAGYLQRLRERMWAAMQRLQVPDDHRRVSAAWAVKTTLLDVSITLADIGPSRLAGYGALDEESATLISGILSDLERLTESLDAYLTRARGGDPVQRMERLETTAANRQAIAVIDAVINRHGLVEMRPMLDAILCRLESPDLEIAVFGRVSCGKSSLLNYLMGRDVLPVGVLPVTAVLTRLRRTESPSVIVRTEVSQPREVALDQIADYVTEERNPRNRRQVVDVTVGLRSERLSEGVTFIDTPGVGSLATFGAAQTRAYLPRCDVGLLLVDAGSTLDQQDLALLSALKEAGSKAYVIVSKGDLLETPDRQRMLAYISRVTQEWLEQAAPADVVSTRGADASLTDRWFQDRIRPIMLDHKRELQRSIRRKIGCLVESASALLAIRLHRLTSKASERVDAEKQASARNALRDVDDRIAHVAASLTGPLEAGLAEAVQRVVLRTSEQMVSLRREGREENGVLQQNAAAVLAGEAAAARARMEELCQSLAETAGEVSELLGVALPAGWESHDDGLGPMPPLDEARLSRLAGEGCSRLLATWPSVARRRVAQRLRTEFAWDVRSLMQDYRRCLRRWTEQNLRRATNAFEARIAVVRAALDAPNEAERTDEEAAVLRSDLESLEALRLGTPESETASG